MKRIFMPTDQPRFRNQLSQPMPPNRLLVALQLLIDGYRYAQDVGATPLEFAITMETMQRHNVAEIDILWLQRKGYVVASPNGDDYSARTRLTVSSHGLQYARQVLALESIVAQVDAGRPNWDGARRELRLGMNVVKRFRVPAPNQELILRSFQEESWPSHIDDPIPPTAEIESKRRLRDTILALNRGQNGHRIRFCSDGTGDGVCWEVGS